MSGSLQLAVDEYCTEAKCKQAFDTDLAEEGVLALLVKIENNSPDTYEIYSTDFTLRGDEALRPLSPQEAAGKAKRNAVGRAVGWSLIVPIIAIPVAAAVSANHTKQVNDKIAADFSEKAFNCEPIPGYKERSGFLFYEIPKGRNDLSGLELEVNARKAGTIDRVSLVTPLPNATFKQSEEAKPVATSEDNEQGRN